MSEGRDKKSVGARRGATVARRCPICSGATMEAYRPFCSKRCADVDLGRWMNESYAVPAQEADAPDFDAEAPGEETTPAQRGRLH